MRDRQELLMPIGRLVGGSLYTGTTTDLEGRPKVFKTGENIGKPRTDYYFLLAITKGNEKHWNETSWGKIIYSVGQTAFPGIQINSPNFAWKIIDGDSDIPVGDRQIRPCDREGYSKHWVLNFSSCLCAPDIYNADGSKKLTEPNAVNPGDYIEVYGSVVGNESKQNPGVHLNHKMVAYSGYGKRIFLGVDPKSVFGKTSLPSDASPIPIPQGFNPISATTPSAEIPKPYPDILNIPVPVTHVMLPKANGITYEQYIANGWTDTLLVQHGMMQA